MTTGGSPNMQQLLAQAQQMQEQLMAAQEALANTTVKGTAGGGLVTAEVTGSGELVGLVIDPKVIDPEDPETIADLVIAAVRDANRAAAEVAAAQMGPLAQGFGGLGDLGFGGMPGLPGQ